MGNNSHSRRKFMTTLGAGAMLGGLSLIPGSVQARMMSESWDFEIDDLANGKELDKAIKALGKMAHPVAYDMSQHNPWGFIWSNVYYLTNEETGTAKKDIGILNVLRHHGMIFGLNDATIAKYDLGEFFGLEDPLTKKPAVRNPFYIAQDGVFPLPGLAGIKGLSELGAKFCICDMARKVYSMFVSQKVGAKQEDVYNDFVEGTLPEVMAAPSGVWALGRLAENGIAYIDASVG